MKEGDRVTMHGMEWDVISVYTRKQAIEDGVLVDLTKLFPSDTRIYRYPVACTETVWSIIERACMKGGDPGGCVWDLCYMSALAVKGKRGSDDSNVLFKCCIPLGGRTRTFKIHIGPGDDGEPVITIMLPEED